MNDEFYTACVPGKARTSEFKTYKEALKEAQQLTRHYGEPAYILTAIRKVEEKVSFEYTEITFR